MKQANWEDPKRATHGDDLCKIRQARCKRMARKKEEKKMVGPKGSSRQSRSGCISMIQGVPYNLQYSCPAVLYRL